ncbi:MAG: hypothetical protein NXH91_15325 [Phyllobacteriaceae bacterium]|jgi:type II secretory pathway pseudopilin PulG|nr:hypothetical protein [Phyllobacteriaceae bacterium]
MAKSNAKGWIGSAVMAVMLLAGTTALAAGPRYDASIDRAAAEQVALRMGAIRGSIATDARLPAKPDAMQTHSVQSSAPSILPALVPFSGPIFALFHEPIARPMPERRVRIVYGGSLIVASAQGW